MIVPRMGKLVLTKEPIRGLGPFGIFGVQLTGGRRNQTGAT